MAKNIKTSNLNHFYGANQALFDVNLEMKAGDIIVLLGSSGAGKSTFIRTLNLLEVPKNGTLEIAGMNFDFNKGVSEKEMLALRRKVGMVFQQYNLWPHKTVRENLTYVPVVQKLLSKEEANKKADALLERLDISAHAEKYPLQLSGGQQQRVAICRALMMEPEVLLYDEPTAALDPSITEQVANIIKEFKSTGVTQVVVTHDVGFAKQIADYIVYFDAGKVVEEGDASIFTNPQTEALQRYLQSVY